MLAGAGRRLPAAQADGVAAGVGEHADPCLRRDLARGAAFGRTGRVMQRANDGLGTNWTVHDLRPTAGARMVAPTTIWAYRATGSLSSTEGGEHVREAERTLTVPGPRPLLGHSLRSGLEGPEYAALVLSVA